MKRWWRENAEAMVLLELEHVHKRYGAVVALDEVSFSIEPGEMVCVWGQRRSGRSTLLRIAAGIESPDAGTVRFVGRDLAVSEGHRLGAGVSYCRRSFRPSAGRSLLDHLVSSQLVRRLSHSEATARAWLALKRVDAGHCGTLMPGELSAEETVRVSVARGLTSEPRLLVIDEPTVGVDLLCRDRILALLRSIADEGVAILTSTSEGTGVMGADRVLSLGRGQLHGEVTPELAPVTLLRPLRQATGP